MDKINGGFPPLRLISKTKDVDIKKERFYSPEPVRMASIKNILKENKKEMIINVNNDIEVVDDF
jgi:hypothetical protein